MMDDIVLLKKVQDAKLQLTGYKGVHPRINQAIQAFDIIEQFILKPTEDKIDEIKNILKVLNSEIGPYGSYVPRVHEALQSLNEWIEKQ